MERVAGAGMRRGSGRPRFRRHAARTLAVSGVALGVAAIACDWTGFGWLSGPAAITAIGAVLLAFAAFNLPTATESDDRTNTPNVSSNTDNE